MNPSTNCPKRPEERGRYLNLSPSFSEDPSSTPRGPGVEHSETALAFEVTIGALPSSMFTLLCPTAPSLVSLPPQGPTLAPSTPSRLWGPGSRILLESGQTPEPQELTTATSAQTVHCQVDFLDQPECREPGPSRVEGRFIFLLTSISQLPVFPRTNLQPRFPWLSLPCIKTTLSLKSK